MRPLFAVSLVSIMLAGAAVAAPAPQESWGKPGVSFERYRQDAIDCTSAGYYRDIAGTADAQAFVRASRQLDTATSGASAASITGSNSRGPSPTDGADQFVLYANQRQHIVDSVHPEQRFHNIKQLLQSTVDQCLQGRGYSKFRLTDDQRHALRRLKFGSDQRRAYLYSLASNPAVVAGQMVPPDAQRH